MNVFIGGSRAVSRLNPLIRSQLGDLIRRRCTILIGDANGADKAVQQYLAERRYPNVEVFCMERCRNNIGAWPTRSIAPPSERKGFSYYAAKDAVMSQEAKCGVMLWDGKSKGTLQNIVSLIRAGKRSLVYFAPAKGFFLLASDHDLQDLLTRCDKRRLAMALGGLGLEVSFGQPSLDLYAKH